jgi:hypothetical protein|tara:strand:+ start:379 stop:885 length:507 start_codon:yes stop_codon:yes gene_type:complete
MSQIERITSKGQVLRYRFAQDKAADSQSAVALKVAEGGGRQSKTAAIAGGAAGNHTVTGIATADTLTGVLQFSGKSPSTSVTTAIAGGSAGTAGTLTVDATIDGTVTGLQAALDATNTTYHNNDQHRGLDKGTAGQRVGAKITTASWTPVSADIVVDVYVLAQLSDDV